MVAGHGWDVLGARVHTSPLEAWHYGPCLGLWELPGATESNRHRDFFFLKLIQSFFNCQAD